MPEPKTPKRGTAAQSVESSRGARLRPSTQSMRLARKTQSLDILYEIAANFSRPGSLEQMAGGFLDVLIEMLDARAGSVRLAAGDGQTRLVASRGIVRHHLTISDESSLACACVVLEAD